jgi:hypothetical protein
MKISILATLAVAISCSVMASANAAERSFNGDEAAEYGRAVADAAQYSSLTCGDTNFQSAIEEIRNADDGTVETSGTQPVLTLVRMERNSTEQREFKITTSSDFKLVLQIQINTKYLENTNHGTLIAPNFQDEWVQTQSDICK